jgi:hypothetical protein
MKTMGSSVPAFWKGFTEGWAGRLNHEQVAVNRRDLELVMHSVSVAPWEDPALRGAVRRLREALK